MSVAVSEAVLFAVHLLAVRCLLPVVPFLCVSVVLSVVVLVVVLLHFCVAGFWFAHAAFAIALAVAFAAALSVAVWAALAVASACALGVAVAVTVVVVFVVFRAGLESVVCRMVGACCGWRLAVLVEACCGCSPTVLRVCRGGQFGGIPSGAGGMAVAFFFCVGGLGLPLGVRLPIGIQLLVLAITVGRVGVVRCFVLLLARLVICCCGGPGPGRGGGWRFLLLLFLFLILLFLLLLHLHFFLHLLVAAAFVFVAGLVVFWAWFGELFCGSRMPVHAIEFLWVVACFGAIAVERLGGRGHLVVWLFGWLFGGVGYSVGCLVVWFARGTG